jgi:hypothetical protein
VPVQRLRLNFQRHLFHCLFVFYDLRRDVVVCFFDIGGIVDHHCITFFSNDMEAKQQLKYF